MPPLAPLRHPAGPLRFALPPSLGPEAMPRAHQLEGYLAEVLSHPVEISVPSAYEQLARELLTGRADAAWAPPFVCARIEAMGVRVLVRGVRSGASTYRGALIRKAGSSLTLQTLAGARAAWSDRDSVGGYLLPMAFLRESGVDTSQTFARQVFSGSYRSALEAVANGEADVTAVFAPSASPGVTPTTGIAEVWPDNQHAFEVLAYTEDAPNDGIAVAMATSPALVSALEHALVSMHQNSRGAQVLAECFRADRFEAAPRMGYRALYRVALASL